MLRSIQRRARVLVSSAVGIAVLGASSFLIAPPASAISPTIGCGSGGSSSSNAYAQAGTALTYTIVSGCDRITVTALSGTLTYNGTSYTAGTTGATFTIVAGQDLTLTPTAGTTQILLYNAASFTAVPGYAGQISVTASNGGGGGGGGSQAAARVTPAVETLSIATTSAGATCTGGNPTGYAGAWLTLPSADQCTPSGTAVKADAKLLGWSTHQLFPVDRAQSQIDKHWGVIDEVIDGSRMIFIPAGMATFVSGSNMLFPIWSA